MLFGPMDRSLPIAAETERIAVRLALFARENYGKRVIHLALRIDGCAMAAIEGIVGRAILDPVGWELVAPDQLAV